MSMEQIRAFEERFTSAHLDFACHAALPLAVTPDLLYHLWGNFNCDRHNRSLNIPWVAVSDLLLSGLCEEVGHELYEMKREVREALLERLKNDERFGEERLKRVARLLLVYVQKDLPDLYLDDQEFKESQAWTAWAYLKPEKTVAALAAEFERAYQENPADLMRLVALTEVLHQPIEEFDRLRIFARAMGHFCRKRFEDCKGEMLQLTVKNNQVDLGNGVRLNVPSEFLTMIKSTEETEVSPGSTEIEFTSGVFTVGESGEVIDYLFDGGKYDQGELAIFSLEGMELDIYYYEIITLNEEGEIVQRQKGQNQGYLENTHGLNLEMVMIPAGEFMMGSPKDEAEQHSDESPQHLVNVPQFWMSRTAITQAQWQIVAQLPQVVRSLKPDPANFKGNNNPVERVSWEDCIEFCLRLSQASGKLYRLPSEAEWEYACRAGTTTPFYFGYTLSRQVANCRNFFFSNLIRRKDRQKTSAVGSLNTPNSWGLQTSAVGSLNTPNSWGLHDMHGNVWEWCLDDWHDNYQGAPRDGMAWINNNNYFQNDEEWLKELLNNQSISTKPLRGGSWNVYPKFCRSANRGRCTRDLKFNDFGFRVVAPRTL